MIIAMMLLLSQQHLMEVKRRKYSVDVDDPPAAG